MNFRRVKAFTLVELMVSLVVFMILTTSLVCSVAIGLRHWLNIIDRVNVGQNIATAINAISCEMKQSIINPDPGGTGRSATGYVSVSPAILPSGVIYPNSNQTTQSYVDFSEPSATYDPTASGFADTNPANYRRVKFYVDNNILYREQKTYTSAGVVESTVTTPVVKSVGGVMTLSVVYSSTTTYNLSIYNKEGNYSNTMTMKVYIPTQ